MAEDRPYAQLSDEELVRGLQGRLEKKNVIELGDYFKDPETDAWFREIYLRYQRPLEAYCSRFVYDRDELADLFHDIFIKIFIHLHKYRYTKSFRAWVYRIAHNSAINHRRKSARRELSVLNRKIDPSGGSEGELIDFFASEEEGIEKKMIEGELRDVIENALKRLPSDWIGVFHLRTEGKLTFDEIADTLGISSRSAKTFHQNVLIFLREELEKLGHDGSDLKR